MAPTVKPKAEKPAALPPPVALRGSIAEAGLDPRIEPGFTSASGAEQGSSLGFTMSLAQRRRMAEHLYHYSPLARGLIDVPLSFQLGTPLRWDHPDDDIREMAESIWSDDSVNMDIEFIKLCRQLSLDGELFIARMKNTITGNASFAMMPPEMFDRIEYDPVNPMKPIILIHDGHGVEPERKYRVVGKGFSVQAEMMRADANDGEVHYFRLNETKLHKRGNGDLTPMVDWIRAYEDSLFEEIENWSDLRAFIYHVSVQGADKAELDEQRKAIGRPDPGEFLFTNERTTLEAKSPGINASDVTQAARLFRNHILTARAFPEHWFGGGGDVNRATAAEMDTPTINMLQERRNTIIHIARELVMYEMESRLRGAGIGHNSMAMYLEGLEVIMPPLTQPDPAKNAQAFGAGSIAAYTAHKNGFLTREGALKVIATFAENMGVELDPEEEMKYAEEAAEKQERENQMMFGTMRMEPDKGGGDGNAEKTET